MRTTIKKSTAYWFSQITDRIDWSHIWFKLHLSILQNYWNEAALVLKRFSPFRYFPTNLDFRHILSVIPDYEILQGETAKTYAENQDPNL